MLPQTLFKLVFRLKSRWCPIRSKSLQRKSVTLISTKRNYNKQSPKFLLSESMSEQSVIQRFFKHKMNLTEFKAKVPWMKPKTTIILKMPWQKDNLKINNAWLHVVMILLDFSMLIVLRSKLNVKRRTKFKLRSNRKDLRQFHRKMIWLISSLLLNHWTLLRKTSRKPQMARQTLKRERGLPFEKRSLKFSAVNLSKLSVQMKPVEICHLHFCSL